MKAKIIKYFNEIVSLIVMGLLVTALVAGQASGETRQGAHAFEDKEDRVLLAQLELVEVAESADPAVLITLDITPSPRRVK